MTTRTRKMDFVPQKDEEEECYCYLCLHLSSQDMMIVATTMPLGLHLMRMQSNKGNRARQQRQKIGRWSEPLVFFIKEIDQVLQCGVQLHGESFSHIVTSASFVVSSLPSFSLAKAQILKILKFKIWNPRKNAFAKGPINNLSFISTYGSFNYDVQQNGTEKARRLRCSCWPPFPLTPTFFSLLITNEIQVWSSCTVACNSKIKTLVTIASKDSRQKIAGCFLIGWKGFNKMVTSSAFDL